MSLSFQAVILLLIAISPLMGTLAAHAVLAFSIDDNSGSPQEHTGVPAARTAHCEDCGDGLNLFRQLPLMSWFWISRRCRHCGALIPILYPATQLGFFICALFAAQMTPAALIVPSLILSWILITLFAFDITSFVLPNLLTYTLLLLGLGFTASQGIVAAQDSGAGVLAGGASLLAVKLVYRFVSGREGLGLGDVKLFAAAGAWVGIEGLPQVLLVACLTSFIFAAAHIRGAKSGFLFQKVPFGAGLCFALWLTWTFGPFINGSPVS